MVHTCVVRGCKKESYPGCGLSFHRVPVNEVLKIKWMEALQKESLPKYPVVCSLHFKDEDFITQAKKRLKPEAIPTILTKASNEASQSKASPQATMDPLLAVHQLNSSEIETCSLPEVDEEYSNGSPAMKSAEGEEWLSWPDACRCCLATRGVWDLTGSYMAEDGETEVFLQMLTECYGIKLSHVSEFGPSRLVCAECAASLRRANRFKRQVLQAEERFAAHYGKTDSSIEVKEEDEWMDQESTDETPVPQTSTQRVYETSSNLGITQQPTKRMLDTTEDDSDDSTDDETPVNRSLATLPQKQMKEITYNKRSVQVISYCPKNYDDIEQNIEKKIKEIDSGKRIKILASKSATDNANVRNLGENEMIQMVSVHSMDMSQSVKRDKLEIYGRSIQYKPNAT